MKCAEAKRLLSPYLDGAVSSKEFAAIREHLAHCSGCARDHEMLLRTSRLTAALGRKQPPPELALRLQVMLAREVAASRRPRFASWRVRFENAMNAFAVPATAGALSAVIVFGLLIGFFALPSQLRANDVPTGLYTPPELRVFPAESAYGPFAVSLSSVDTDSVVVEASIDSNGRVQDYRVISAPDELKGALPQLKNLLIFTQFRPATSFGQPVAGKAVISFAKVNVKG